MKELLIVSLLLCITMSAGNPIVPANTPDSAVYNDEIEALCTFPLSCAHRLAPLNPARKEQRSLSHVEAARQTLVMYMFCFA